MQRVWVEKREGVALRSRVINDSSAKQGNPDPTTNNRAK